MRDWTCDGLPERLRLERGGIRVDAWPALVPRDGGVAVELLGDADAARRIHRHGLRVLFRLRLEHRARDLWRNLVNAERLALQFVTIGDAAQLRADLFDACVERLCVADDVRDARRFAERLATATPRLEATATALAVQVDTVLSAYRAVAVPLAALDPDAAIARDVRTQLDAIVYPGFITATPAEQLGELPRYLEAARRRVEKYRLEPGRERARAAELAPWVTRWQDAHGQEADEPELAAYHWLLEEYRVSLYAQELGTAQPASAARLARLWARVESAGAG